MLLEAHGCRGRAALWSPGKLKGCGQLRPVFLRNLLCAGPCSRHLHICAIVYNSAKETFCRERTFGIQ